MNVLLVGGAGYIGSQVVRDLRRQGKYKPVVLDNLITGHSESLPGNVPFIRGSYRNTHLVTQTLKRFQIGTVMHFGAKSLVGESMRKPKEYWKANVKDGLSLLKAMQAAEVKHLLFSSTAAVYGKPQQQLITERHPTTPVNPYGKSKLALEELIQQFVRKSGFHGTALRYFNVAGADRTGTIGEDHTPETHLIPNILKHAAGLKPYFELYGKDYPTPDGTCIRDYVDVRDVSSAYLLLLQKPNKSGKTWSTYNLGSGHGYSNAQVIQMACEVTGQTLTVHALPRRAGDPAKLVASAALFQKDYGWKPKHGLKDMVASAWKWHSKHPHGYA